MNLAPMSIFSLLLLHGVQLLLTPMAQAEDVALDARAVVCRHVGIYTTPPDTVGTLDPAIKAYRTPDGPLMGNGDIAVAVGGTWTNQTFYLSKSDLSHSGRGLGGLTIAFPGVAGDQAGYRQEQDIYRSEVRSILPLQRTTVHMRSWTADAANVLVTEIRTADGSALDLELKLWSHVRSMRTQAGTGDNIIWSTREMNGVMGSTKQPFRSSVAMATRVMGAKTVCATDGKSSSTAKVSIPAGKTMRIITVVAGGYEVDDPIAKAQAMAAALTDQRIEELLADHLAWWERFWSKSCIVLNDDPLERFYYGALYTLGCASRAGCVAPGLAGPWHLDGPICWSNKYTLDYNFESVWWGVYSCNRAELALPYYDVILGLLPAGRLLAQEHGTKGVLFGVNAHAWKGFNDTRTLNMKGNASLAALNFLMHYQYTRDEGFLLEKAWPLLKELAIFWEDNLVWDAAGSRWVINDSGAREGQKDMNAITDLSMVRRIFGFLLETAPVLEGKTAGGEVIHISDAQKNKWRGYVDKLSVFPTIIMNGKTVFKEAENRKRMSMGGAGDNSDVMFPAFPSEAISLGSDVETLAIAMNTVAALNPEDGKASWFQANCFPKIYTQAVRSGYPAEKIVANWKRLLAGTQPYDDRGDHVQLRNNLTIVPPVHAFESVGAIEAINSMLLQSHDQTIRVFPVWITGKDAAFKDLLAYGAFLVSSAYRQGVVSHIDLTSEAGGECRVWNPWPGTPCKVVQVDAGRQMDVSCRAEGNMIIFATAKGRRYRIQTP